MRIENCFPLFLIKNMSWAYLKVISHIINCINARHDILLIINRLNVQYLSLILRRKYLLSCITWKIRDNFKRNKVTLEVKHAFLYVIYSNFFSIEFCMVPILLFIWESPGKRGKSNKCSYSIFCVDIFFSKKKKKKKIDWIFPLI